MQRIDRLRMASRSTCILVFTCTFIVVCFLGAARNLSAQEINAADDQWTTPINLSESGVANDPIFFQASNGTAHLFWQDELAGYIYSFNNEDLTDPSAWSAPIKITVPFTNAIPHFQNISEDRLIAFWIGESATDDGEDLDSALLQSVVNTSEIISFTAWTEPMRIADSVLVFENLQTESGQINLGYLGSPTTDLSTGGLYYRFSDDEGENWSDPELLYESAYLRPGVVETAHLSGATSENNGAQNIFFAWDNPALEKVFVVKKSIDTWGDVTEVDQRLIEDAQEAVGPGLIKIFAANNKAILTWRAGHGASNCTLYFSYSITGGLTWEDNQLLPLDSPLCPDEFSFIGMQDDNILLMTDDEVATSFYAFDGNNWSIRQEQDNLKTFTHPNTFRDVSFDCLQPHKIENSLVVVGCGSESVTDIWLTERLLRDVDSWFSAPSSWSYPASVSESQNFNMVNYELVGDSLNNIHLVYNQPNSPDIYYLRWNGSSWSSPVTIITSPDGNITSFAMSRSADARLQVVWQATENGIYFSQATVDDSIIPANWSTPQQISGSINDASFPAIATDNEGKIHVVFSVPFNEQRGIYTTISTDGGLSWESPIQLFDGTSTWSIVGPTQIALADDGNLSILMSEQQASNDGTPQTVALHFAKTTEVGESLNSVEVLAEGDIEWSSIIKDSNNILHRLYLRGDGDNVSFAHDLSSNNGDSWVEGRRIANLNGKIAVISDEFGKLRLIQLYSDRLQEWEFSGGNWERNESWEIPLDVETIKAASSNSELMAAFIGPDIQDSSSLQPLNFTVRSIEPAETPPLSEEIVPSTNVDTLETTAVAVNDTEVEEVDAGESQTPNPTPSFSESPPTNRSSIPFLSTLLDSGNATVQLMGSVLPALLVVCLVIIVSYVIYRGINEISKRRT